MVKVVVILFYGFCILAISRAYAAYGGHAQAYLIAIGLGAVALEVAVQSTLAFSNGQVVVG